MTVTCSSYLCGCGHLGKLIPVKVGATRLDAMENSSFHLTFCWKCVFLGQNKGSPLRLDAYSPQKAKSPPRRGHLERLTDFALKAGHPLPHADAGISSKSPRRDVFYGE
jgi:hypothetical protein